MSVWSSIEDCTDKSLESKIKASLDESIALVGVIMDSVILMIL